MSPNLHSPDEQLLYIREFCPNITKEYLSHLRDLVYESDQQARYNKPMPWIGIYIAVVSLFCIIAMVADFLHGFRNKKLWFPCKYFTLNAASLTLIAVAVKLPMDLTNLMPGYVDQAAKLGSVAFTCTMMANLLPSIETMDNKELVSNIIALGVLVITLAVNVSIQINTGAIDNEVFTSISYYYYGARNNIIFAKVYVGLLLMLLIIYACSSLAILKSKQILESKYQSAHQTAIRDQELQQPERLTVERLIQHVSNYCVMAGTGSPQFMIACFATTSASGVICVLSTTLHTLLIRSLWDYKSNYKWSTLVILIIQYVGVIVGTIAPLCRCFASVSFKLSVGWIWNHIRVSLVESYWTQKLYDWKQSSTPFPYSSRKCKIATQHLKILILSICIGFQKTIVVACKLIAVIPVFFVICVVFSFRCWKWLDVFSASCVVIEDSDGNVEDVSRYVVQLQDDMEFAKRTLDGISQSVKGLILKAAKQQPKNLKNLILRESRGFRGIVKFDSDQIPPLLSEEYLNCWSLPLITLTTIAIALRNSQNNIVSRLLSSVSEGLVYVTLVEECLNATDEHVSIHKAAKTLWVEVEVFHKWLGIKLQNPTSEANTTGQILQWLRDIAKNKVAEVESENVGVVNDSSSCISIAANSMYRITETILLSYHAHTDQLSREELFAELISIIADILAACLSNLPQVIVMKCHTSSIEKRETNVYAAVQLLGETNQIINALNLRKLPSLNPNELAFIEKWRAYLSGPFP